MNLLTRFNNWFAVVKTWPGTFNAWLHKTDIDAKFAGFIRDSIVSLPWLAVAIIFYFVVFSHTQNLSGTLGYGLYKICWALIFSWVADRALFWLSGYDPKNLWHQGRRVVLFCAICHLLSLA
jgi:hypothetical protein